MNSFFGSVFWLAITLGVLVTFHEFGHYWVARRCGVKVLRFSVGFGKAIWKRTGRDGTEYQIASIPLGGYVKMLDAREGEVDPALRDQEFTSKSVWKRIAIVAAGPGFNVIFTLAAFWLMFMIGRPDAAPVVTAIPQSIAAIAGVQSGDYILKVDGHDVTAMTDAFGLMQVALASRTPLPLTVRGTNGQTRQLVLPLDQLPAGQPLDEKYFEKVGLQPAPPPAIAANVMPGKPAALGGMQGGDRLLSVNGKAVSDFLAFGKLVQADAVKSPTIAVAVERNGQTKNLSVVARWESLEGQPKKWVMGVAPATQSVNVQYGPVQALGAAVVGTWRGAMQTYSLLGKLITGQVSSQNLSGVIGIAQVANQSAGQGIASFLEFLAAVSLSLAILNLLPIPVLDGGHLLYYLIELVKGSPVSEQTMIVGQYIGLALLFTMMGLAFYNDIHRILLS
jgi:regulator of sigma E protease